MSGLLIDGWGGGGKKPAWGGGLKSLKSITHPTMMILGIVITYLIYNYKKYMNHVTQHSAFC